jgi:stalled ribosome rescue protein Dom34
MATDPTKSADLAAVIMQEGLAHVCLVIQMFINLVIY